MADLVIGTVAVRRAELFVGIDVIFLAIKVCVRIVARPVG